MEDVRLEIDLNIVEKEVNEFVKLIDEAHERTKESKLVFKKE